MNDYWFVLGTTTALRGNDYCCSLVPRSFRFTYSRLFGVKQYRVPAVSTLERLSCLALKVESQRWMENEPVLVDDLTSTGQLANQYRYIFSDQYWSEWRPVLVHITLPYSIGVYPYTETYLKAARCRPLSWGGTSRCIRMKGVITTSHWAARDRIASSCR